MPVDYHDLEEDTNRIFNSSHVEWSAEGEYDSTAGSPSLSRYLAEVPIAVIVSDDSGGPLGLERMSWRQYARLGFSGMRKLTESERGDIRDIREQLVEWIN